MEPIKRVSDATNVRGHPKDALLRQGDVKLSEQPSEEWSHAFKNAPGLVLPMLEVKGDTITFPIESEAQLSTTLSEIDRRIRRANRVTG